MSMGARFVQVTPDLLEELMQDEGRVGDLFKPDLGPAPAQIPDDLRQQAMRRLPQLLANTAARMSPAIRSVLEERLKKLGTTLEDVQTGKGAEAIIQMMERSRHSLISGQGAAGPAVKGKGDDFSLDKAWHGVHYLLCGQAQPDSTPLGQAVLGGTEIGDDDFGYGPARCFSVKQVGEIARELGRPGLEDAIKARFDPTKMNRAEIYPHGWDTAGAFNWLLEEFHHLRDFYAAAGARQLAVVTCIM
jgi:hypothetical protein